MHIIEYADNSRSILRDETISQAILDLINREKPKQFNIGGYVHFKLKEIYPTWNIPAVVLLRLTCSLVKSGIIPYNKQGEKTFVRTGFGYKEHNCALYNRYPTMTKDKADKSKKFWLVIDANLKGYFTTNNEDEAVAELTRLTRENDKEYILIVSVGKSSPALPPIKYERY